MLFHKTCKIFFLFLLASPLFCLSQQWVQTRGPGGGYVLDMLEKNGSILSATRGGIFRSTNNGDTWLRSQTGFPDGVYAEYLTATTNFIYAASYGQGLFRSADNGISWTNVPVNIPNLFILEIFASGDVLYLGMDGSGVLRSTDEAASFQFINNGFTNTSGVGAFAVAGPYLYAGVRGNGGSAGMYRTLVNSINWQQINTGLFTSPSIGAIAVKGTDLFITAANSSIVKGVFRSDNLGDSWNDVSPPLGFSTFSEIVVHQGNIYTADDGNGVYKTTNDGANWTLVNNGLKPLTVFSFLAGSAGLFIGCERGVARSIDNAASWTLKYTGLTNTAVTSLVSNGNTLYATTRSTNIGHADGVFFTLDAGQNWNPINEGLFPNPEINALAVSGSNIIITTENYGVYVKTPTNPAFMHINEIPVSQVNAVISSSPYVLAGVTGFGEIYRSADNGVTWIQSNSGTDDLQGDQIYSFYNKGGIIYAGGFNALYKTTDFGLTWTNASSGIYPGDNVYGITGIGNDLYAVTLANGIYKSTNNGVSWFNVNNGIPAGTQFKAIIAHNGVLYAGSNNGVYRSIDNGANWTAYNDGLLSARSILSFAVYNNQLVLGTEQTAAWFNVSVLPVQLLSFTAAAVNNNYIKLVWKTSQENGIQKYVIGRAIEGTNEFIAVGNVDPSNSLAEKEYNFNDYAVKRNLQYQYRLLIADASGDKYSEIRTAKISGNHATITIVPNPTDGHLIIDMHDYQGKANITVTNSIGQHVYVKSAMTDINRSVMVNISSQPKGIYIVKIRTTAATHSQKVFLIK